MWGFPCGVVFQLVVVGDGVVASVVGALRDGGCAPACLFAVQVRFPDWYEMDHAGLWFSLRPRVVFGISLLFSFLCCLVAVVVVD